MELEGAERIPMSAGRTDVERPPIRDGKIAIDFDESPLFLPWSADTSMPQVTLVVEYDPAVIARPPVSPKKISGPP